MHSAQEIRNSRDSVRSQIESLEIEKKDKQTQIKNLTGSLDNVAFTTVVSDVHDVVCKIPGCYINQSATRCPSNKYWTETAEGLVNLFSNPGETVVMKEESTVVNRPKKKRRIKYEDED